MGYERTTIKKIVTQISKGQVYLPAIQRKFVWDVNQIEKLFDSIMMQYPIGTFLFWKVDKEVVNDYVFYKFIQEYHERDSVNERAPMPACDSIIGILDGQQRLTSLYIALQGSYAYKKAHARRNNNDAYVKRQMYFNLLKNTINLDTGITYEFKFLTADEAAENMDNEHWFLVKEALTWNQSSDYIPYLQKHDLMGNMTAMQNIQLLWECLVKDNIINYYEITNQELDKILDIFVRVNSGGTPLSKSDLLFSTIVANWEDAREKTDGLIKSINAEGNGFDFNNDFIMRLCLALTDCPIKFKVSNFTSDKVEKIKEKWVEIEKATKTAVNLLKEFGLSKDTLTSNNIVIPVAYYIFNGGLLNKDDIEKIRKFLLYGMLKQVFGSGSDSVLSAIREVIKLEIDNCKQEKTPIRFNLEKLKELRIGNEYKFKFTESDIETLVEEKKGVYTYLLLSLLCPNVVELTEFHQDHMHPASFFDEKNRQLLGYELKQWEEFCFKKDCLPNLQLLEGKKNQEKSVDYQNY